MGTQIYSALASSFACWANVNGLKVELMEFGTDTGLDVETRFAGVPALGLSIVSGLGLISIVSSSSRPADYGSPEILAYDIHVESTRLRNEDLRVRFDLLTLSSALNRMNVNWELE